MDHRTCPIRSSPNTKNTKTEESSSSSSGVVDDDAGVEEVRGETPAEPQEALRGGVLGDRQPKEGDCRVQRHPRFVLPGQQGPGPEHPEVWRHRPFRLRAPVPRVRRGEPLPPAGVRQALEREGPGPADAPQVPGGQRLALLPLL